MDISTVQSLQTLLIRQRITLMQNRYDVMATDASGSAGPVIAHAAQKRLAFREQVTIYTDDSQSSVLAGFKARQVMDLGATYDVTDSDGAPIGLFRKDFAKSLLRSTWHLEQPSLGTMTGQERSMFVALLRRFSEIDFLPYHFDFTLGASPAFSVVKKWGLRDTYLVTIADPRIDRRLVIAMAIALDALQGR